VDRVLDRATRKASLKRFWTTQNAQILAVTTLPGTTPQYVDSDGTDVWVANTSPGTVARVRGSDGKLLETWTGAFSPQGIVAAAGLVFVAGNTGSTTPGNLYRINPSQAAGVVTTVTSNLGASPRGIAFDGARVWTANNGNPPGQGSISIVSPGTTIPWGTSTVSFGFGNPFGVVFDGANVWVTDQGAGTLLKVDVGGAILQTVTVGTVPALPAFDGVNIWVPNALTNSVSVVRASSGTVLATLTANGMNEPYSAAFDGERILVTNLGANAVSLWKAADLNTIGNFNLGTAIGAGACSDGLSFWFAIPSSGAIARF
jgi:hypothetical protein